MKSKSRRVIAASLAGLLCLLAVLAGPAIVLADATAEARAAIQAVYDRMNASLAKKDLSDYFRHRTADYVYIDKAGSRTTGEESRRNLEGMLSSARSVRGKTVIQTITVQEDRATVVIQDWGRIVLINPQTNKEAVMVVNTQSRDLWVKQEGRWMKKKSTEMKSTLTIDGKRISR